MAQNDLLHVQILLINDVRRISWKSFYFIKYIQLQIIFWFSGPQRNETYSMKFWLTPILVKISTNYMNEYNTNFHLLSSVLNFIYTLLID